MVADFPKADLNDYTKLGDKDFWTKNLASEFFGTAFFFFGNTVIGNSGLGLDAGSSMALSYLIFGGIFKDATLLSAFSFNNLMKKKDFGFFQFVFELFAQMFGAAFGFWLFGFLQLSEHYPAEATAALEYGSWNSFFQQVVAIAFFLYLFNKQEKSGLEKWIFTLAAFYLTHKIHASVMLAGSSLFTSALTVDTLWAVLSWDWVFTYFVQLAGAVVIASIDYFFE